MHSSPFQTLYSAIDTKISDAEFPQMKSHSKLIIDLVCSSVFIKQFLAHLC